MGFVPMGSLGPIRSQPPEATHHSARYYAPTPTRPYAFKRLAARPSVCTTNTPLSPLNPGFERGYAP
jgi:hypothetical protein